MAGWITRQLGGEASGDYNLDDTPFVPEPSTQDSTDIQAVLKAVVRPLKARQWGSIFSDNPPPNAARQCSACGKFLISGEDYQKTPHFPYCMLADLIQLAEKLTENAIPFKRRAWPATKYSQ